MRTPLQALVWEIWRRGFKLAAIVAGILAMCAAINRAVPNKHYLLRNFEPVYWLLMVVSLFLTFGIFHYAEHNRAKNWHGFPYRMFSLPVRTSLLVACPILLGVACVEVVYWWWAKLVFAPIGRSVSFWPAACVGVGMICYQAIVWGLAGFRITRIIVLSFTGLLLANLGMVPLIEDIKVWPERQIYRWATTALVVLGGLGAFGAWFLVERQRRGGGRGRGWLKRGFMRVLDLVPRRTKPFDSPAAAQFWYEWRRSGQMLPLCVAAILLLFCGPLSWLTRADPDSVALTVGWVLALPVVLSAVIGKGFASADGWSTEMSLPPFLAVRPFASGDMVVTKMKVAGISVIITWALVIAFLGCYLPLWADPKTVRDALKAALTLYSPTETLAILGLSLVAAAILSWRLMVGSMWVGLSGSLRMCIASAVAHVLVAALVVAGLVWVNHLFYTHVNQAIRNVRWIGWGLVGAAALKLALSLFSWKRITPTRTKRYLALWWIGTLCFVALALTLNPQFAALRHIFILAAFVAVPLARLGLAPSFLANNRHRK